MCGVRAAGQQQSVVEVLPGSSAEVAEGVQRKTRRAVLSDALGDDDALGVDDDDSEASDAAPSGAPAAQEASAASEESESGSEVEDDLVASSPRCARPAKRPAQQRALPQCRAAPKLPLREPSESAAEGVQRAQQLPTVTLLACTTHVRLAKRPAQKLLLPDPSKSAAEGVAHAQHLPKTPDLLAEREPEGGNCCCCV